MERARGKASWQPGVRARQARRPWRDAPGEGGAPVPAHMHPQRPGQGLALAPGPSPPCGELEVGLNRNEFGWVVLQELVPVEGRRQKKRARHGHGTVPGSGGHHSRAGVDPARPPPATWPPCRCDGTVQCRVHGCTHSQGAARAWAGQRPVRRAGAMSAPRQTSTPAGTTPHCASMPITILCVLFINMGIEAPPSCPLPGADSGAAAMKTPELQARIEGQGLPPQPLASNKAAKSKMHPL